MATPIKFLSVLTCLPGIAVAQAFSLDPRDRDEFIGATDVQVTVSQNGEVWTYEYELHAGDSNKGTIQFFNIGLGCDEPVDNRGFDPSPYPSYPYRNLSEGDRMIPVALSDDYGASWDMALTRRNEAMFAIKVEPGTSKGKLRIHSPYGPGQQRYTLRPYFELDEIWDYPEDTEINPEIPKVEDFQVTGIIVAPSCPGNEDGPAPVLFDGSALPWQSEESNRLLRYEDLIATG